MKFPQFHLRTRVVSTIYCELNSLNMPGSYLLAFLSKVLGVHLVSSPLSPPYRLPVGSATSQHPKIFAWNASNDNPVGVPYILQEYIDNVVEPWQVWGKASDSTRSGILDELAQWHTVSSNHFHAP